MQERLICCCGSSGWSRVIGWFQTIGNAIMVLLVGYQLGLVTYFTASNPDILDDSDPIKAEAAEAGVTMLFLFLVTLFILTLIATVMGIVLLRGSYHLRPDLLRAWIIYAHVGLIAGLVILTTRCFYAADNMQLGVHIVSMVLSIMIQGFCIWVVRTHKLEIEMDYQRMGPITKA